ncbi:MAG: hypothetical protein ACKOPS_24145 [Cyanobium sp.]
MPRVQLFLSTVSAEFLSYRERLRQLLTRPDVEVKVQEDFISWAAAIRWRRFCSRMAPR